jgi:NAD(P)-dependent dehydrogenase (short-subunit alcohol dehydrogenase family)
MRKGTKVALVTGAASGIGRATAEQLARRGYCTYGVIRNRVGIDDGCSIDHHIRWLVADVTDEEQVARALQPICGEVTVLVNCAGIVAGGAVELTPLPAYQQALETNFLAPMRFIRAVLPGMRVQQFGRIVNVTSLAAIAPVSPQAAYAASKAALEVASEALAQEVAEFGIRVVNVEPGIVATPIHLKPIAGFQRSEHYAVFERRLVRFVRAMLSDPLTADAVADRIAAVVEDSDPPFRLTVGRDADAIGRLRQSLTDRQWTEFWALRDDCRWSEQFEATTGLKARD